MAESAVAHPSPAGRQPVNDVTHLLTSDHRTIETCVDALRSSVPGHERARLVAVLAAQLTIHLLVEEVALHPMVRDILGCPQEEESDVEHELIRSSLAQVNQLVDAPGFHSAVEMLSAGITRHIVDEEESILPVLLRQLGPDEQMALGEAIAGARRSGAHHHRASPASSPDLPVANAFNPGH